MLDAADFKLIITIGGTFIYLGGMLMLVIVNGKNITALWNQKQDKNVCTTSHQHIEADIKEIKTDVKTLLTLNGRQR